MSDSASRFDDRYVLTFFLAWVAAMVTLVCGSSSHDPHGTSMRAAAASAPAAVVASSR